MNLSWAPIVERAAQIVLEYDTGVTLRQLFYRLVAAEVIPNTKSAYKTLSRTTAKARRQGDFPTLLDRTRTIHKYQAFTGPEDARQWLSQIYRRDRTEGQDKAIFLGVEKHGIVEQLRLWFGDTGIPIISLGGYSSQTYVDEVAVDASSGGRAAVLIYAGDFDPSGMDIDRDFKERTACFDETLRVALNPEHIQEYNLPPQVGKATDSRAASFVARYGQLVQVELDALPPDILRDLYQEAINRFWDESTHLISLEQEDIERGALLG